MASLYEEWMKLVADYENGEVCKYVRCSGVPAEIIDWFNSVGAE